MHPLCHIRRVRPGQKGCVTEFSLLQADDNDSEEEEEEIEVQNQPSEEEEEEQDDPKGKFKEFLIIFFKNFEARSLCFSTSLGSFQKRSHYAK